MPDDSSISDDPGTILDSYESVLKAAPAAVRAVGAASRPAGSGVEEILYKSPYRWKSPRILICDDDSLDDGETVHVRSDKVVIGRTKGDIVIGHDVAMSSTHAEIVRKDVGGRHGWVLRDLGSSNGTFARVKALTLTPSITVLIGSKRYLFVQPGGGKPAAASDDEPGTALLSDLAAQPADALPALVESLPPGNGTPTRHLFRKTRLTIGRPGCGNDIEVDDLCTAASHAVVTRDYSGAWQIEAQKSLNGIWVQVKMIQLVDNCMFQCGEQRFRFML